MTRSRTFGGLLFNIVNVLLLIAVALICIFPFIEIVGGSFATSEELLRKRFVIIPQTFSLEAYRLIFSDPTIPKSLLVSVFITVAGTLINLFFTSITAFALSRKELKGRRIIMLLIVFTMLFDGGLIPGYLVVRELHMLDTYWAVLIPGAISAFNLILMRNFFIQLPEEMFDSARIDGCNDLSIFYRIALPLSKASLATFTLFYAVGHWNNFFSAFLYLNKPDMWPIQLWLRNIIVLATYDFSESGVTTSVPSQSLQNATIVIATLPILIVYPFVQKHFAKGVMLGSVKG
ncbi:carbohydrate ABC transporter permease [Paenibacillus sp. SAF-054]|uniref:carbohydrate ABC transporter permease n=1 Tax=unclassified Paenibacillus TaxID=185978 RepID=UPI003F8175EC